MGAASAPKSVETGKDKKKSLWLGAGISMRYAQKKGGVMTDHAVWQLYGGGNSKLLTRSYLPELLGLAHESVKEDAAKLHLLKRLVTQQDLIKANNEVQKPIHEQTVRPPLLSLVVSCCFFLFFLLFFLVVFVVHLYWSAWGTGQWRQFAEREHGEWASKVAAFYKSQGWQPPGNTPPGNTPPGPPPGDGNECPAVAAATQPPEPVPVQLEHSTGPGPPPLHPYERAMSYEQPVFFAPAGPHLHGPTQFQVTHGYGYHGYVSFSFAQGEVSYPCCFAG